MLSGSSGSPMLSKSRTVMVELTTAKGTAFSAPVDGVELRTTAGVIAINPLEESYLNLTHTPTSPCAAARSSARSRWKMRL